jgi:hypothetical protein
MTMSLQTDGRIEMCGLKNINDFCFKILNVFLPKNVGLAGLSV